MKSLSKLLLTAMLAVFSLCGGVGVANAADLVMLPFINNALYEGIETVYYDNYIDCVKEQDIYNIIENEQVTAAIEKYKNQLPSEEAMRAIAEETQASLVIGFELDKLVNTEDMSKKEPMDRIELSGKCVVYNMTTGFYKVYKIHHDSQYESGYYTRQNLPLRIWARTVRHEMHRALGDKKFHAQKVTISKKTIGGTDKF